MALVHCNFFSYSLGYPVDIQVILPSFTPNDMKGKHTHTLPDKFPVIYLLHGYGGDHMAWLRYTSLERYAEEYRIAVVTFSCHNKAYHNAPLGENFYDFLNSELPEFVENYFPIASEMKHRFIAGLSMGGYGALMHGIENPERYRAIGAFSPGIPDPKAKAEPERIMRTDLHQLTQDAIDAGKKLPELFMCIGENDFLYDRVIRYHKAFEKQWTGDRYRFDDLPDFEHEFAIWDIEVLAFIKWIRRDDVYASMDKNKV